MLWWFPVLFGMQVLTRVSLTGVQEQNSNCDSKHGFGLGVYTRTYSTKSTVH